MAKASNHTPAPAGLPSVEALGRALAHSARAHEEFDQIRRDARKRGTFSGAADNGMELHEARQHALRELISTLPAVSLADCAVQLAVADMHAETITGADGAGMEARAEALERICASVIPVIAEAAGMDLAQFDLEQFRRLREVRFPLAPDADE